MGQQTPGNNTQPGDAVPTPSTTFQKGDVVYIRRHIVNMGGVDVTYGGVAGKFVGTSYGPQGSEYITIYSEGFRTFPLKFARSKRKNISNTVGHTKGGKIVVECVGLPDKPCSNTREIHASDKHLVTRCKDCQKVHAKVTNRERMRQRRAEKRNATKQKKMGRSS